MPRPTATPAPEASESTDQATAEQSQDQPVRRQRRKITPPEGVTLGLGQPVKAERPPVKRGAGREVSQQTRDTIELLTSNPGETFLIGVYGTPGVATGPWKEAGIRFSHSKREDGLYDRYATKVVDEG